MKLLPYLLLLLALTGCDFGEDKLFDKVTGGGEPTRYFSVSSVTVAEGDTAVFTVSFNRSASETMTVPYSTSSATAIAGSDFTATSGTLTFVPGETSKTISVTTLDDALVESSERFFLAFGSGTNYETGSSPSQVVGIINDTDSPKTIHAFSATAAEGNAVQFTVSLSEESDYSVTVDYATSDGTATLGDADYTSTTGTLTFAPGETTKTVNVPTTADTDFEEDESITLTLSGGSNYEAAGSTLTATGTIVNEDSEPTVFFAAASAAEGNPVTFTINLSNKSYETVTLNYATSHGTAGASDYTPASGTLTFTPGDTSETIPVTTAADLIFEGDETFTLTLSGGANYTSAGSTLTGTGTITNNDIQPTVAVDSVAVTEGGVLAFTVTLSNPSSQTVTVDYATANGTATLADSDYTSASGTLTFAAGETTKSVNVSTTADARFEPDETLALNLSGGANYNSVGSTLTGTGTITNDDAAPTLAIDNVSANEGSALSFTVTLSAASSQSVTVDYATSDGTATTGDSDYSAASGTLTFAAGETTKTITVISTADIFYEANETVNVTLSGGTNYTSSGSTLAGTGTITNDDTRPTVSVADASAAEGASVDFTVQLSHRSFESVTINYATSSGTAGAADFTAATGTLVFAAGEISKTISVSTTTDASLEADETFTLTLSGGGNYTSAGSTLTATGTITNDDAAPTISIADTSSTEGTDLTFTVTLSAVSSQTVTIDYATSNGTATLADFDYASAAGTLTFAAGDTSKTITVNTTADTQFEANETLTVTLSGGTNYTSAGSTLAATGTINNDDAAPTVSIADASANEGNSVDFTVTLSHASSQTVTVNYALTDGTATLADSDFPAASGTVTFTAGDTSETLSIATTADTKYEADETFTVTLSGGANYAVSGSTLTSTGTITNEDAVPNISIGNASGDEAGNVTFTVTQDRLSSSATTFSYATAAGTATGGGTDFTDSSGTGTISAGATTVTMSVPAAEDALDETDETFTMTISSPAGANITAASGTGTITDTAILMSFLAGSLPSGTSFTRASSATYIDSSGTLVTATSNNPRFDYDPTTLTLRGLLMEPASTNLLTFSADFSDTDWSKSSLRAVSANSADAATPDGVNSNAELIRESGGFSSHVISQAAGTAVAAGTLVHFTVYAKDDISNPRNFLRLKISSGANSIYANFDLTSGNSPTTGSAGNGGGQLSAGAEDAGSGWKRLRVSGVATTSGTALTASIYLQDSFGGSESYSGDNSSGLNLWGAQLEAGTSVATSYIPTGAAAASRAAETLSATAFTGFSGNFGDGTNFTVITDFSRPFYESTATSAVPQAATLCTFASCSANRISQSYSPATSEFGSNAWVSGTQQGESISSGVTPGSHTIYQIGTVKTGTSLRTFLNGTAQTASGSLSFPTADALYLAGGNGTGQISGHLRKFTLRARAVSAAAMASLTGD